MIKLTSKEWTQIRKQLKVEYAWKPSIFMINSMKFELTEGRVFGARYYTVKPEFDREPGWYNQHWNDMTTWCVGTFGPTPEDGVWTPGSRWYANNAKFWFRNEVDRTLFILKWR